MTDLDSEFQTDGVNEVGDDITAFETTENMTPEKYASRYTDLAAGVMERTGMFQAVSLRPEAGQVNVMGRVTKDQEGDWINQVVKPTALALEGKCESFFGKQYFPRDGKFKFAWVIAFKSKTELREVTRIFCDTVAKAVPTVEVMESPLSGGAAPQSGGRASGRRGAHPIGA